MRAALMMNSSPPGSPTTDRGPVAADAAAATTGGSVLRGSFWNVASTILPQLFVLVMSVVAARFLGPEDMGRQSFIAFIALSATSLFGGGIAATLMRYVGEMLGGGRPGVARDLAGWGWGLASIWAAIGTAVMVGTGLLGATPQAAWILAGVGAGLGILQSIPNAVLVGAQEWRRASMVGLVTGTIGVPLVIGVLAAGGGIAGMFAVDVLIVGANLIWSGSLSRGVLQRLAERPERDPQVRHAANVYARWALLSVLLATIVFKRSEFFFLNHYATDHDIAIYSISFAAVYAITTLTESLVQTLLPAFATLFGGGHRERIEFGFDRAQRLVMMTALPLTAATVALGPEALALVYGRQFSETGQIVQILAIGIPLLALMNLAHAFMIGLGRVKTVLAVDGTAAVVNLSLAFLLIPAHHTVGAALANLIGQCLVAVIVTVYALRAMQHVHLPVRTIVLTATTAAAGGLAAYGLVSALGGVVGLIAGLLGGTVAFLAVGSVLKIIRADDAGWLVGSTAGTRFAGPAALLCRILAAPPTEAPR
ncbi:MAG TPA: polysaccharide biosynthesis C-terminal domain-containing protein [Solirubrobacterales bacterium]|nr:polysaccharide biosynthesis C-terminal domain-containing protein [Solirubrobacterales bacterium]